MLVSEFSPDGNVIDRIIVSVMRGYMQLWQGDSMIAQVGQASEWAKANLPFIRANFVRVAERPSEISVTTVHGKTLRPIGKDHIYKLKGVE